MYFIFPSGSRGCRRAEIRGKPSNLAKTLKSCQIATHFECSPEDFTAQHNSYSCTVYTLTIIAIALILFSWFQETPFQANTKTYINSRHTACMPNQVSSMGSACPCGHFDIYHTRLQQSQKIAEKRAQGEFSRFFLEPPAWNTALFSF